MNCRAVTVQTGTAAQADAAGGGITDAGRAGATAFAGREGAETEIRERGCQRGRLLFFPPPCLDEAAGFLAGVYFAGGRGIVVNGCFINGGASLNI